MRSHMSISQASITKPTPPSKSQVEIKRSRSPIQIKQNEASAEKQIRLSHLAQTRACIKIQRCFKANQVKKGLQWRMNVKGKLMAVV